MPAGRKLKKPSEKTVFKKISVYQETYDLINLLALKENMTICSYMKKVIEAKM
jgi:hypothetical protein